MSGLEVALLAASTAVSAVGAVSQGIAQKRSADAQAASMKMQAKERERQAGEERAASQREAAARAKEARLVLSRQQAVAAATGGGATDSSVLKLMGDTAAEGAYQVGSAVYEGESRGRVLDGQADIDRYEAGIARMQGRQAMMAGFIGAGESLLNGASTWASMRPGGRKRIGTAAPTPSFYYGS